MHNCIDELCAPGKKYNSPNFQNSQQDNHFLDQPFGFPEFSIALNNVSKNSAPDYDKIDSLIVIRINFQNL